MQSLLFYDLETWGIDPKKDRVAQFAAIRTTLDLKPIGEPINLFCIPSIDHIIHPESVLITGLTPQQVAKNGVNEAEFFKQIHMVMSEPNTCVVGYNNIRFDDEFIRFGLWRNLTEPYGREWQNGNSRWDLLDIVRATYALRPDDIKWSINDEGSISFKLEDLAKTNELNQSKAHDALSDVEGTIDLARLIKGKQPKLFEYAFTHRGKQQIAPMLDLNKQAILIHTTGMYPVEYGCTSAVLPVAPHPQNNNGMIVFDLRHNPNVLLDNPVDALQEWLFMPKDARTEDTPKVPLKAIMANKSPFISPVSVLRDEDASRLQLDKAQIAQHAEMLKNQGSALQEKIQQIFSGKTFMPETDPEYSLYSGGFLSQTDKIRLGEAVTLSPEKLKTTEFHFEDKRLNELLFRYRARNYPESLSSSEKAHWHQFLHMRLFDEEGEASLTFDGFNAKMARLRNNGDLLGTQLMLLDELEVYVHNQRAQIEGNV